MRVAGRRLLAVLAGGVVLVGGGVTTLAAWQDQGYDHAPLSLQKFNIQQTLDGSEFVEADTAGTSLRLALSVNSVLDAPLTPGNATTGWVGLRVDPGSLGAKVVLGGATIASDSGGIAPHLSYQAVAGVDAATCRAGGTLPTSGAGVKVLVGETSALTAGSGSTSFQLDPGTGSAAGATVGVCFKVKLDAGLSRTFSGSSVSPVWTFNAESLA